VQPNRPPPHTIEIVGATDVETGSKLREHREGIPFGEDVGELGGRRDMNISNGDTPANEVKINLNMLGALMLDRVGGEVDRADVVAVDQGGSRQGVVQLQKQLMEPTLLCHTVGYGAVLRLRTRTGDNVLTL
jgi:hypothetical protein